MGLRKILRGVSDAPVKKELDSIISYMTRDLGGLLKEIRKSINVQSREHRRVNFHFGEHSVGSPSGSFQSLDTQATYSYEAFANKADYPSDQVPGTALVAKLVIQAALDGAGAGEAQLYDVTNGAAVGDPIELSSTSFAELETTDLLDSLPSGLTRYRIQYRYTSGTPGVLIRGAHLLFDYQEL